MERKIGEIFEYNGEWYQCIEGGRCNDCDFDELYDCNNIACTSGERNDDKEAYFKKLEKVGEPFYDERFGLVQKYKLKIYGYSTKDKRVCFSDGYDVFIKAKQNKEDMEEKKLNLKPFDIQKAREGKPVCTRDGRKARIICFDSNGGRPIVALVTECDDEEEMPYKYHCDGFYNCQSIPSDNDLMMLPKKKKGWVNIYKERIYSTKEEAIEATYGSSTYIDTIKFSWEE